MAKLLYENGVTSVILRVRIWDTSSTTGAGLTGKTHSSSGLIISTIADSEGTATAYTSASSNVETITTLGTFAAPTSGKCRFKEVDATNHPGIYEIQIADARWAVGGARSLIVSVQVTGGFTPPSEIQLTRPHVDVRLVGGTPQTAGDLAAMLSTIDDYVDTEVAAIKAKTDNLPSDPADASDIAASFSSVSTLLTTIASYIDTEVAAIKAKTDGLVFDANGILISSTYGFSRSSSSGATVDSLGTIPSQNASRFFSNAGVLISSVLTYLQSINSLTRLNTPICQVIVGRENTIQFPVYNYAGEYVQFTWGWDGGYPLTRLRKTGESPGTYNTTNLPVWDSVTRTNRLTLTSSEVDLIADGWELEFQGGSNGPYSGWVGAGSLLEEKWVSYNPLVRFVVLDPSEFSGSSGTGTGARVVTITVDDGTDPIEGARVRLAKGAESYISSTDVDGEVVFNVDDGTWTVSITASRYSFDGDSLVVNGTETATYSMTAVVIPAPASPGLCTVRFEVRSSDGTTPVSGATVSAVMDQNCATDGILLSNVVNSGLTDSDGIVDLVLVQSKSFIRGSRCYTITAIDPDQPNADPLLHIYCSIPNQDTAYAHELIPRKV